MIHDSWPFVGRESDLAALASRLLDGQRPVALLLAGPAGVGKTWLARALAEPLARAGRTVVRLHATTALSTIPFAALAPLLVALDLEHTGDDPADVGLLAAIRRAAAARPDLVLLVDDASRADPGSLATLAALIRDHRVPAVLTARDTDRLPEALVDLLDDGSLATVAVGPLDRGEADELLARVLGGAVDPGAARELHEASGGNPLFLRELVRGALDAGTVEAGPHGFVTGPTPSRRLVDLVVDRFEHVDDDERRVLELLAAGQPLHVEALAADAAVDRLDSQGLVTVEAAAGVLEARLGHPLYDEVLRSSTPSVRWRRRLLEAAALLAGNGPDADLRSVALQVEAGSDVAVADLVAAARRAQALLDHHLAASLAALALAAGGGSPAHLIRGASLSATGLAAEATAELEAALALAVDDAEVGRAAQALGLHLAVRAQRPADAVRSVVASLERITDHGWTSFLRADLAKWRMMAGHGPSEVERPGLAIDGTADSLARLNGCIIGALIAVMGGRLADADAAIDEGLPLADTHRDVLGHARELLLLSRYLVLVFDGRLVDARGFAESELDRTDDRREEPVGMWAYALGVLDLDQGRAGDAAERAALAVTRLEWRDYTGLRPTARALQATALAHLGRRADAAAALGAIEPSALADPKVAMQDARARAWLDAGDRRLDDAAARVAEHGRAGIASGHVYLGALTLYDAVRFGRAALVCDDLAAAAATAEGGLLPVFAAHATAAAADDAEALLAAAHGLEALGTATAAADACDDAAAVLTRRGDHEGARRARLRGSHLAVGHDGARRTRADALDRGPKASASDTVDVPVLTAREREVAVLAAGRLRSREIATKLSLSVRTVDNHLARAYRKLDVASREELALALRHLGLLGAER